MFGFVSLRGRAQVLLAAAGVVGLSSASHALTLGDVTVWTGDENAENRSGLIIEWGDGKSPVVYGYQYDGAATGLDMLQSVVAERPELYAKFGQFGSGQGVLGLGLDRDNDGFAIDDGGVITLDNAFTNGSILIDATAPFDADGGVSVDSDDSYGEGWFTAYFQYFLSDGASDWASATVGAGGRALTDGDWDAYVYAPGFSGPAPSIQVPEPSSAVLFGLTGLAMIRRRRRIA